MGAVQEPVSRDVHEQQPTRAQDAIELANRARDVLHPLVVKDARANHGIE